jgi:guanylate kinase
MADALPLDQHRFNRRGILFIVSSPSGAGKSTISRKLLVAEPGLEMSVSATTRDPRPGEADGKDYHFVTVERFKQMVADNEFLEWAHVFGHRYGTPKGPVEQALSEGRDVLFDIDWQGAQQLYQQAERRLRGRRTDSDDVITARMARAAGEISHWDGYDYVLVNDDADACFKKVQTILGAERLKRSRQTRLIGFVRSLTKTA